MDFTHQLQPAPIVHPGVLLPRVEPERHAGVEGEPGMLADMNVIDFDGLRIHPPEMVYDLPAGGKRLVQKIDGYRYTIKSGQVTFEEGEPTGALPGKVLRGPQPSPHG